MAILPQLARIPKIIPFAHLWSEEISDLLYLRLHSGGVQHCWEENTDIYVFHISDLIKKYALKTVNKRLSRMKLLNNARQYTQNRMVEEAAGRGANAVVGIDCELSGGGTVMHISMFGTAVKIEKITNT